MSIHDYTGKRFSFRNYNCWQHVIAVRHAADISTMTNQTIDMSPPTACSDFNPSRVRIAHGLELTHKPRNYDILVYHFKTAHLLYWHCGIVFNGCVSHCCQIAKQVIFQPMDRLISDKQGVQFWR